MYFEERELPINSASTGDNREVLSAFSYSLKSAPNLENHWKSYDSSDSANESPYM